MNRIESYVRRPRLCSPGQAVLTTCMLLIIVREVGISDMIATLLPLDIGPGEHQAANPNVLDLRRPVDLKGLIYRRSSPAGFSVPCCLMLIVMMMIMMMMTMMMTMTMNDDDDE